MSRYLFTVWPFVGHVNPFLSVAKAVRARGHEVAFYTGAHAQAAVEEEGFTVFPFRDLCERRVWNIITAMEGTPVGTTGVASAGRMHQIFRDFVDTTPGQVTDLERILTLWNPDALVCDPAMWGPYLILWERHGIPVALLSTLIGCLIPGADGRTWGLGGPPPRDVFSRLGARAAAGLTELVSRTWFRPYINGVRTAHGLPALDVAVHAFAARLPLYLVPSLPELDFNRDDLPASVRYVGPCIWTKPPQAATPSWVSEPDAEGLPWVHVTEGTLHYQEPILLRAAVRGLAGLPMRVIITTGGHRDPDSLGLGPIAPNVWVERYLSHSELLPRCAALVTTGGAGTIMAGLQAGLPQVIVPTHWDKPDNARRLVAAGAGLSLSPGRCTPSRLRDAIRRVLEEPRYRENAQRLARRLAESPGPSLAAELLEALARSADTAVSVPS